MYLSHTRRIPFVDPALYSTESRPNVGKLRPVGDALSWRAFSF